MKHLILAILILFGTITIYKSGSIIPKYYIKETPHSGVYKVHKPGSIVPKYIIRNNKLYKPNSIVPLYELKERKSKKRLQ